MNRLILRFAAVLFVAQIAGTVEAHHSGAMYDYTKELTLEGTVREYSWTNPHVTITLVLNPKESHPGEEWILESTSPGNLRRVGWTKESFKPGDRVKALVHPIRTGEPRAVLSLITLTDTGKEFHGGVGATESKE